MKNSIIEFFGFYRPHVAALIVVNVMLFGSLYLLSDEVKEEREVITEGLKAIAWVVSAPSCEVRGFCHTIVSDEDAGLLKAVTVISQDSALSKGWSQVETTTGFYHIHGSPVSLHAAGSAVKLFVKRGSQSNVLCIEDTCYLVPFVSEKRVAS